MHELMRKLTNELEAESRHDQVPATQFCDGAGTLRMKCR